MNPAARTAGAALAAAINLGLGWDPRAIERLAKLDGQAIDVQLTAPAERLRLTVAGRAVRIDEPASTPANAEIRGAFDQLMRWLVSGGNTGNVEINGDTELLLALADIARNYRPDVEQQLSALVPPETTRAVLGGAELLMQAARSAIEGATLGMREAVGERFTERAATDEFLDRLDDLTLRVDRLRARVDAKGESRA